MTLEALVESLNMSTIVIGELTPEARQRLEQHPLARLAPEAACARRAGYVAELGWRLAQSGDPGDPGSLDAFYIST